MDKEYSWFETAEILLGDVSFVPSSGIKALKPQEPFSIWWRHHVVYTRVWYPFKNDALSKGERLMLVITSLCFGLLLSTRKVPRPVMLTLTLNRVPVTLNLNKSLCGQRYTINSIESAHACQRIIIRNGVSGTTT